MAENMQLADRGKVIIRTSIIGIVVNILLAGFKFVVGIISGSIAIMLDAVNNLSDALSSVITIIELFCGNNPWNSLFYCIIKYDILD